MGGPNTWDEKAREALDRFLDLLSAKVAERLMAGPSGPEAEEGEEQAEEEAPRRPAGPATGRP